MVAPDKSGESTPKVREARNQPPREVRETIGLVEWTTLGKPRRGDQELEEKIAAWRRRQGSTEVRGETESENEEEYYYRRNCRPAFVYA